MLNCSHCHMPAGMDNVEQLKTSTDKLAELIDYIVTVIVRQVLFDDRTASYSLCQMLETWGYWPAHDFGTGAAMCGAALRCFEAVKSHPVRIPATNPLILGWQPGEVFFSRAWHAVGCDTTIAVVPFEPVWALPADTLHANKTCGSHCVAESSCTNRLARLFTFERLSSILVAPMDNGGQ